MFSSLFVALFVLCAPVAASNSTIVCVAGQCMQGSSNTTLGISLSASDVASSVLLLPGQYTAATNPELVHDLLTSSHATLSPHPGFGNSSALALPLNVAVAPGLAIYAQTLYSGQAAFSALPSAPVVNGSTPLTAESMAISSSVWVALSFGTNGRVVLWDSVPDTAQLPLSSKGPMSLLDMQSSTCFPPCASSGTCSASGTCACAPGFYGTSCETCAAEFFGPTCQACPAGCASCDEGISGTGRCLTPPIANPLTACNCLNGECAPDGSCVCNPGWTTAANGTACAKCASGFFATSTGDCKVCELGCTSCADGTGNCLTCGTHFTQDQNDATKCITVPTTAACPDGSFSSDGTNCVACSASCSTCFGPTSNDCALCPNLHYLTNNGSCVIASSTGVCDGSNLIADNNKGRCDACGAKCTSCEIASFNVASTVNQLKCTGCLKGTVLSNGQCIDTCPTGTFLSPKDNVTCTACDSSCSTCSGSATSCLTCPTGQLALNGKCVNTCPSNTFSASGACLACHTDCATCSGPSFTQCASCPSNRPVLSSGRCLPTCSKAQFFDIASGTCQPCNGSCSSCSGSGPTNCLACSSASQVLRAGACTAATCNDSTSVVSGLGVCLSDLVIVKPIPSSPSVPAAVTASGSHQKTQTRAKVIGCSVSGISLLGLMSWYWRRYLRRCLCNRRAKQTAALAASKRLDPKKSWRWRLLRFGERFFGHKASRRASPPPPITTEDVESEVIKLRKMRSAEEALHHLEMEKLQLFGAYEYSHAGSVRSSSAPSSCSSHSHAPSTLPWLDGRRESDHHTSIAEQVSRASIYSQVTGEPRTAPEPRQPVNKNLLTALARYPSSVSSAGRSVSRASIYSQVTGELHTAPEPSQPVNKNLLTAPLFSENSYLTCNRLAESVLATTKRAKKVKSSSSTVQQEDQSDDEELPPAPRARTTRAHPPAPINDSEDEGKQPASAKRTVTGKTKPAAIAPKVKARLIADSASEASSVSQDSNSSGNDSDSDDNLSDGPMEITVEEVRIVDPVPKRGSGTSQNSAEDESPNVQCSGGVNLFRPDIAVEIHRSGPRHHRAPSTSSMHSFSSVPGTSVPDTYDDLIHTDRNSGGEDDPNSDGEDAFEDEAPPQRIPGKSSVITSSEDESEEALNIKPKKQNIDKDVRKAKMKDPVKSARQKKAEGEQPGVRPALLKNKATTRDLDPASVQAALPESSYHHSARVAFPPPGKEIRLTDQPAELRSVLNASISTVRKRALLQDAFPANVARAAVAKSIMLKAAGRRPEASYITARLKDDPRMSGWLAPIVMDRLTTLRSEGKKYASNICPGMYCFATLDAAVTKALLDDLVTDFNYIYHVNKDNVRDEAQPFRHGAIIKLIKHEWLRTAFIPENHKAFRGRRKNHPDQLEVPDTILALAATLIFAALVEYQMTGTRQRIKFTETTYEDVYRRHLRTLADNRKDAPNATSRLLHQIYQDITNDTGGPNKFESYQTRRGA